MIRPYDRTDRDWLVERHSVLYHESDGFDETFPKLVASILDKFSKDVDPDRDKGWIAFDGNTRLGSIFCVGTSDPQVAKLRLFFVEPAARGNGIGQRLLDECCGFARATGAVKISLWTHKSHESAVRLYRRNNFVLIDERPVRNFGQDLVEQEWERMLGHHDRTCNRET